MNLTFKSHAGAAGAVPAHRDGPSSRVNFGDATTVARLANINLGWICQLGTCVAGAAGAVSADRDGPGPGRGGLLRAGLFPAAE